MRIILGALAALFLATSAHAQMEWLSTGASDDPTRPVPRLPAGAVARLVALTQLAADISPTQMVGELHPEIICMAYVPITWRMVAGQYTGLAELFRRELKTAGFTPDKDAGDLFAGDHAAVDLQVGAGIQSVSVSYCRGVWTESLTVHWQVYSTIRRETIATVDTAAQVKLTQQESQFRQVTIGQLAFSANVRELLRDDGFRTLVTTPEPTVPDGAAAGASLQTIRLVGAPKGSTRIADAGGSVVTIFAGAGMGSGVLVSSDGYVLTDYHVVEAGKSVRLRWSDGFETAGEVVRSNKARDVALIRTETHGRTPLVVNTAALSPGAPVFAIGTPLDPKLQNTVTRGVISGSRMVEGFRFIQSDAPVTHGNSGGPLLDESGAVVGLTDWGVSPDKGSSLNFFIPIGDALDFLGLKPGA